jgi:hypothetical protein
VSDRLDALRLAAVLLQEGGAQRRETRRAILGHSENDCQVAQIETDRGTIVVDGSAHVLREVKVPRSIETYNEFGNRTCRHIDAGNLHADGMPAGQCGKRERGVGSQRGDSTSRSGDALISATFG